MTSRELIEGPTETIRTHAVLLGAGASRAAFPNGDKTGKDIPVMDDLVERLSLRGLIDKAGVNAGRTNFEAIYAELVSKPECILVTNELEQRVRNYFSDLELPEIATIYDRMLLSLRQRDAIFTFNWDPFLFDAYQRNCAVVPLPRIFFLHGNVRIGACPDHDEWGRKIQTCPVCHRAFSEVPLLYPIRKKNYSDDPFIRRTWAIAKDFFARAFTLTVFGYSAPESDSDAYQLLRDAWSSGTSRSFEHIEIIDIAPRSELDQRWRSFTPPLHYRFVSSFAESRIARWPRRTAESLWYPMSEGEFCEEFPPLEIYELAALQSFAKEIAGWEK